MKAICVYSGEVMRMIPENSRQSGRRLPYIFMQYEPVCDRELLSMVFSQWSGRMLSLSKDSGYSARVTSYMGRISTATVLQHFR